MKTNRRKYYTIIAIGWASLIIALFLLDFHNIEEEVDYTAQASAYVNFNKDQAIRHWAASHGGVYVPIDNTTSPNPALSHIPDRDIETPSGKKLTLMNPAYMIRELNEYFAEYYGVVGHITSKKLLRQENKADKWETDALDKFEKGAKQIHEYSEINGRPYLRMMRPMYIQQSCLKCHGHQDYKVGDVRGGVGVAVPMQPILERAQKRKERSAFTFFLIWVVGMLGLSFAYNKLSDNIVKLERAENTLKLKNRLLEKTKNDLCERNYLLVNSQEALTASNEKLTIATKALKDSNERFQLVAQATADGIWEWNIAEDTVYFSNRFCEIIGFSKDDVEFSHSVDGWARRIHPADYSFVMTILDQHLKQDSPYSVNYRHLHKTGKYKWHNSTGKAIRDINGRPIRMVGRLSDITERIEDQNQLIEAKQKAEESNRLKTEFINNMSHEIRTPMNGILGFSSFLNKPNLTEKKKTQYINLIQSCGKQLLHIIDEILEFSKLSAKQVKVIEKEICINRMLEETFVVFDASAKQKTIPLYLKKGLSDTESTIYTDKLRLNKALDNLLENALKFTSEGFIELGYNKVGDNLEIYVKDTGIGIDADKQQIIFESFSQEEKEISRKVGGLGLGLSIASENIELLGGRISVSSEKNKGSVFTISIPYKPLVKKNIDFLAEKKGTYTVLIAEDEDINYLYLETLLKDDIDIECSILHARNGKEAVDFCCKENEIDLILMDLKMPIMNGFDATKTIKENHKHLPIVAQTAYSSNEDMDKALQAGCDDFLLKPTSEEALQGIINKHLKAIIA